MDESRVVQVPIAAVETARKQRVQCGQGMAGGFMEVRGSAAFFVVSWARVASGALCGIGTDGERAREQPDKVAM